jgi:hypothetical protein
MPITLNTRIKVNGESSVGYARIIPTLDARTIDDTIFSTAIDLESRINACWEPTNTAPWART